MAGKQSTAPAPSKPSTGRQKVHIRIKYAGKEPGPRLTERCNTLVDMVVEADAGTIERRQAGKGAADIYVITRFADYTMETAQRIAHELGIADRTTIKIADAKVEG